MFHQSLTVPFQSLASGGHVGFSGEEPNPAMSLKDQVLDRRFGPFPVVNHHGIAAKSRQLAVELDNFYPAREQGSKERRVFSGRGNQDPVDP
jgi:hypothetical protein